MRNTTMKKTLLAAGLLAAAGAASAQSSVTLFGVVDANLTWGSGTVSDRFQLGNSGNTSSRIGFRGVEDLGGGMSAGFWLEASVANDNGAGGATSTNNQATGGTAGNGLTFGRRATVSLMGNWGELRLGRDYTPQFWNQSSFNPFGANGVATSAIFNFSITGPTQIRASNSIGYILPRKLGGFYGQVQYYLGENAKNGAATEDDGTGGGVRVGYKTGKLDIAAATSATRYAAGKVRQSNIGAEYDFGPVTLMGMYEWDKSGTVDAKGWVIGAQVPVGAGEIRVNYSRYDLDPGARYNKWGLGYVHSLSKRTALYATYARVSNSEGGTRALGGATTGANTKSSGIDIGLRHNF